MISLGITTQSTAAACLSSSAPSSGGSSPTTLAKDNFIDTNGTTLGNHTMGVGSGWYSSGIGGTGHNEIENDQAVLDGDEQLTVISTNAITVSCDLTLSSDNGDGGLTICDNNGGGVEGLDSSCLRFDCSPTDGMFELWLITDSGGNQTLPASSAAIVPVGGTTYHMKAEITVGGPNTLNITCSVNGTSLFTYAYTPSGADGIEFMTNAGIQNGQENGLTEQDIFNNFLVTHP